MMADKDFNLFDEYAARYVICTLRKKSASFLLEETVKSGSIANSQRTLNEINKTNAITVVRILVEQVIL